MLPDRLRDRMAAAVLAVREAGAYLREARGDPFATAVLSHDVKLQQDRRSEEIILGVLGGSFPADGFLCEETGAKRSASGMVWVVDPLDGSMNYFRGIPHCCVSIACQSSDGPMVGVVYDFLRDEMFAAEAGGGSFLNGSRVRVSGTESLSDSVLMFGLMKGAREISCGLAALTWLASRVKKVRMMGAAALDLCYVACGRADLFVEFGLQPWDVAAGALILREAGGILLEEKSDSMVRFTATNGRVSPAW